jgi:hypothetical protein
VKLDEPADGPVIGSFHRVREEAGREFVVSAVIVQAFATIPLAGARLIAAIAAASVFGLETFGHGLIILHNCVRAGFSVR